MKSFFTVFILMVCMNRLPSFAQKMPELKLETGSKKRFPGPVFIPVPQKWKDAGGYELENSLSKKRYPLQRISATELVFLLTDTLHEGQVETFRFVRNRNWHKLFVYAEKTDSGIWVKNGEHPVFFYHTSVKYPEGDTGAVYKRSGFIHPLFTPGGEVLTDDFPVGHTHQHALFSAWVNTIFKGEKTDFWNQHQLTGTAKHVEVEEMVSGPVCVQLKLRLAQESLKYGTVLDEKWELRIYNLPKIFLFDLHVEQTNVTGDTLFLPKYIYGGMAFRGAARWNKEDTAYFEEHWKVVNAEGKENDAANHKPARWVQVSGTGSSGNGLVVYDHPGNLRYPQPVRVHPTMPYFVFSPVVNEGFSIAPGGKYRARYRYFTYGTYPGKNRFFEEEQNWITAPAMKLTYKK
ncbi:MAG: PmoA family protein [Chitinophagaceae bacterium]